jgi:hypothetical protein
MAHVISRQHGSQVNTHVMMASADLETQGVSKRNHLFLVTGSNPSPVIRIEVSRGFTQSLKASAANSSVMCAAAVCFRMLSITH